MVSQSNIIILGAPASGKGTQCDFLVKRYGLLHISTGDLLRARSRFLPELAEYMDKGALVPDELINEVLRQRLGEPDASGRGVLLDGYPRTRSQAEMLANMGIRIDHVIFLDVPDEIVIERVEGRRIDPVSGRVYHLSRLPTDEAILGRLIQRSDDTQDKMRKRLQEFHSNASAIKDFYKNILKTVAVQDILPSKVEVANADQVFDTIRKALEGDSYWGTRFQTQFSVKENECGSSAIDILSLTRYFDHLRWRMVNNGCLKDTLAAGTQLVGRAVSIQLQRPLSTDLAVTAKCVLGHVGGTAVDLGFEILDSESGLHIGSGSCELVCVDASLGRKVVALPGREHLLQLQSQSSSPFKKSYTDEKAPPLPLRDYTGSGAWVGGVLLTPADVDGSGNLQTSSVMRHALDMIFTASLQGAFGSMAVTQMQIRQAAVELSQTIPLGVRVAVVVWSHQHASTNRRLVRACMNMMVSSSGSSVGQSLLTPERIISEPNPLLVGRGEIDFEVSQGVSKL